MLVFKAPGFVSARSLSESLNLYPLNALVRVLFLTVLSVLVMSADLGHHYRKAHRLYQKGLYNQAFKEINHSLRVRKTVEAMWLKGSILFELKDWRNALVFLQYNPRRLALPEKNLVVISNCYYELDDYEKMLETCKKVKTINAVNLTNLSTAYHFTDQQDSAIFFADQAIKLDSTFRVAYFIRARAHSIGYRFGDACKNYQKACQLGFEMACRMFEENNCASWEKSW